MRLRSYVSFTAPLVLVIACGSSPKVEPETAATASPVGTASGESPVSLSAAECDALLHEAQAEMDAEHIKVDKPCKTDADCVEVKGHACDFSCVDGAIPKAELADWDAELAKTKDTHCKKWEVASCAKTSPAPAASCADGKKPACQAGHCALK